MGNKSALRISWAIEGCDKWGWEVVAFDPLEDEGRLILAPDAVAYPSWPTASEARAAAVAALRDLADRIERDEK